ncbi:protein ANTI-SILENCING 1 [Forsythia ovata]|uniref:Protein ANTI-SILENCING 1 n=1 Tax=Forsythia ovata TaxID=205694 RepID=A0ABD1W563_9LAMI
MSPSIEAEGLEEPEFKWVNKRGHGGSNKDVQFYESFTYDGVDYSLYDCVYMYKHDEPEQYIGKLLEIWENVDKSKKVKVQWFLRPSEISNYLRDTEVMENEIFLTSGDGVGLANVNPLEAVAGKCNVLCISMDSRNVQPSAEELQGAHYVFYRVFDVKSCEISNHLDDTVGGLPVKFVFKRNEGDRTLDIPTLGSNRKDDDRKVVACEETLKIFGQNPSEELKTVKLDGNSKNLMNRENTDLKKVPVKQERLVKSARKSVDLNGPPSKRAKLDDSVNFAKDKDISGMQNSIILGDVTEPLVMTSGNSSNATPTFVHDKNSVGPKNVVEVANSIVLDGGLAKTSVVSSKEAMKFGHATHSAGLEKDLKLDEDVNASEDRPSRTSVLRSKENTKPGHVRVREKNFVWPRKRVKFVEDSHALEETPRKEAEINNSIKLLKDNNENTIDELKDKSGGIEMMNLWTSINPKEYKTKSKLPNNSSGSDKGPFMEYHEETISKHYNGNLSKSLAVASKSSEERPRKESKVDGSIKFSEDKNKNTIEKLKNKYVGIETKNLQTSINSKEDDSKSKLANNFSGLEKGSVMEYHNETVSKFSLGNIPGSLVAASKSSEERPQKEAMADGSIKISKDKNKNTIEKLKDKSGGFVNSKEDKTKSKLANNSSRLDKGSSLEYRNEAIRNFSDDNLAKSLVAASRSSEERPRKEADIDDSDKLSKDKNKNTMQKCKDKFGGIKTKNVPKVVDSKEEITKSKLANNSNGLDKGSSMVHNEKVSKLSNDNLSRSLIAASKSSGERPQKEARVDDSHELSKDKNKNTMQNFKDKISGIDTKNLSKAVDSKEENNKSKLANNSSGLDKGYSREYHNEKKSQLSSGSLSKSLANGSKSDDQKIGGQIFEVTRRPVVDKSTWLRVPWEQQMQGAHDQGTLVLLQNLDPEYTSREVEDIIWHAFKENCEAKMVQRTAVSCPNSGQAFAIFKTKEITERVVKKLDDGCLMLPNQRPLVGWAGVVPRLPGKQTTFVGHLAIDKDKRQIQREMKNAVSAAHYSQANTLEHEMAMEWCLLQSISDAWWNKLYENTAPRAATMSALLL